VWILRGVRLVGLRNIRVRGCSRTFSRFYDSMMAGNLLGSLWVH
jgi:hypothetical protein